MIFEPLILIKSVSVQQSGAISTISMFSQDLYWKHPTSCLLLQIQEVWHKSLFEFEDFCVKAFKSYWKQSSLLVNGFSYFYATELIKTDSSFFYLHYVIWEWNVNKFSGKVANSLFIWSSESFKNHNIFEFPIFAFQWRCKVKDLNCKLYSSLSCLDLC